MDTKEKITMDLNEECQKCGKKIWHSYAKDNIVYQCGSQKRANGAFYEDERCLRNQLAQKDKEIERLRGERDKFFKFANDRWCEIERLKKIIKMFLDSYSSSTEEDGSRSWWWYHDELDKAAKAAKKGGG